MAKRKPVQAAASGKAPGAQKPKPKKRSPPARKLDPWRSIADHCSWPHDSETDHKDGGLTYLQEQFVEAYLDCGNATEAYSIVYRPTTRAVAMTLGSRLMRRESVEYAIESRREELRKALGITREKLLRVQVAMAMSTMDDFTEVLWSSRSKDAYRGLGDKKHAIQSLEPGEWGTKIKLVDKQAAINELWKKLGFKEAIDPSDERDVTGSVLSAALEVLGRGTGEGSK